MSSNKDTRPHPKRWRGAPEFRWYESWCNPKDFDFSKLILLQIPSPKLTVPSSHLKMDGWNTSFLLGWPIFRGYVSFRAGMIWEMGHFFVFSKWSRKFHEVSCLLKTDLRRKWRKTQSWLKRLLPAVPLGEVEETDRVDSPTRNRKKWLEFHGKLKQHSS